MGLSALLRLGRAGFVLAREGAFSLADPAPLPFVPRTLIRMGRIIERRKVASRDRAERLTAALNRLGPSWVKLGQFLATRPDLVGPENARSFGKLRDEIAPFPQADAEATVARALGAPVGSLYVSFSQPVAAASIAQVHRAEIAGPDGAKRTMAVKIMRPGIRRQFARDLDTFFAGARLIERIDPTSRRLRLVASVDRLSRATLLEMDLRLEAAALSEMAESTGHDEGFRVPRVDWQRTARDVLTLEWVEGIKLSKIDALRAAGHDLPLLARRVMQIFLLQSLRDGFFHADMHQGNLFVDQAGNIVAVDYGITGRLTRRERRFFAEVLYGFLRRDYRRVAELHREAGYVPPRHSIEDFAQALRAIGEPIHRLPAKEISMSRVLTQLFEVTEMFDMEARPELLLLQKTMMVVEGVSRSLDPDFDMWSTSEPIIADWVTRHLGPAGILEEAAHSVASLARLFATLPAFADRAEQLAREVERAAEGLPTSDPLVAEELRRRDRSRERRRTAALWVAALALLAIALAVVF